MENECLVTDLPSQTLIRSSINVITLTDNSFTYAIRNTIVQ